MSHVFIFVKIFNVYATAFLRTGCYAPGDQPICDESDTIATYLKRSYEVGDTYLVYLVPGSVIWAN